MTRTYYLHTLNGLPAVFEPGQGICFASFYGKANQLAASLKQIRAEQRESARIHAEDGFDDAQLKRGHIRVRLP